MFYYGLMALFFGLNPLENGYNPEVNRSCYGTSHEKHRLQNENPENLLLVLVRTGNERSHYKPYSGLLPLPLWQYPLSVQLDEMINDFTFLARFDKSDGCGAGWAIVKNYRCGEKK